MAGAAIGVGTGTGTGTGLGTGTGTGTEGVTGEGAGSETGNEGTVGVVGDTIGPGIETGTGARAGPGAGTFAGADGVAGVLGIATGETIGVGEGDARFDLLFLVFVLGDGLEGCAFFEFLLPDVFLLLLGGSFIGLGDTVDPTSGDGLTDAHKDELSVCDFPLELNLPFPLPPLPDLLSLISPHVGEKDSMLGSKEVPTRGEGEAEV